LRCAPRSRLFSPPAWRWFQPPDRCRQGLLLRRRDTCETLQTLNQTFAGENFNPFAAVGRLDFTLGGIYEPLEIFTVAGGGHTYPWLATSYKWQTGFRAVKVNLRKGVKWSDGKPFTSADVVFTFAYGKKYKVDPTGLTTNGEIKSVTASGKYGVVFHFSSVNTTLLPTLLSQIFIVPQHVFKNIKNPLTAVIKKPVGTGPFTKVVSYSPQEYILGKNPRYWKKLHYDGIKVPALATNQAALNAMLAKQMDWMPVAIQHVQQALVNHDKKHLHYFYAHQTTPLGIYLPDEKYPYNQPALRIAISLSLKRNDINNKGENGTEPPSDALGVSELWPKWVSKSTAKKAASLAKFNPGKAIKILKADHFSIKKGTLVDKNGKEVKIVLTCPSDFSDWVLSMDVIKTDLKSIGIHATTNEYPFQQWGPDREFRRLNNAFFWTPQSGPTPYNYFFAYMDKSTYTKPGQDAMKNQWGNLTGWWSPKATRLLAKWRQTDNMSTQKKIAGQLENIQLTQMPFIPTVYQSQWDDYSTLHFTGFPSASHFYAQGTAYTYPDDLKVLTSVKPVK